MASLLLLALGIVALSLGLFFVLRLLVGPKWLHRLSLGILQFEGVRPKWEFDNQDSLLRPKAGPEALIGQSARAADAFRPDGTGWVGQVRLEGALWRAQTHEAIEAGTVVTVTAVRGLTLTVARRVAA